MNEWRSKARPRVVIWLLASEGGGTVLTALVSTVLYVPTYSTSECRLKSQKPFGLGSTNFGNK